MPNNGTRCPGCARKVPWYAFFGNLALTVYKVVIGYLGGSPALIADGAHSFTDVIGTSVILISTRISGRPPDAEHRSARLGHHGGVLPREQVEVGNRLSGCEARLRLGRQFPALPKLRGERGREAPVVGQPLLPRVPVGPAGPRHRDLSVVLEDPVEHGRAGAVAPAEDEVRTPARTVAHAHVIPSPPRPTYQRTRVSG